MIDRRRILDRRLRAGSARSALHVGIVLAMLGALFLVPMVTASAEVSPTADLTVSQTDTPDPVTSANDVLYEVTVTNLGPEHISDVTLLDTLDTSVTFVSVNDSNCSFSGDTNIQSTNTSANGPIVVQTGTAVSETVDCTFDGLESGMSVVVDIVVQAPSVSESATITNVADVSSTDDGVNDPYDNNHSSEDTTVNPQTEGGQVTGYIPPEGGKITTNTGAGATGADTTVLTESFGAGPGGEASVQEIPECTSDTDLGPCIGNIGDFQPPPGYDKLTAVLLYDRSVASGGLMGHRKQWKIYYQKNGDTFQLDQCGPQPVANELIPCWKSIVRVGDRDLRVRVFINSDPKLATRK